MRFAYADPPYLGQGAKHYAHHPEHAVYDSIEGHRALVDRLELEFPDGYALSLSTTTLDEILPLVPRPKRIGAWVKTFAFFKPGVNPCYAWEPVIFRGGRKRGRSRRTIFDWLSCPNTYRRGVAGAKPDRFCWWVLEMLGAEVGDEVLDVFPGSGAFGRAHEAWKRQPDLLDSRVRVKNQPRPRKRIMPLFDAECPTRAARRTLRERTE